VKAIDTNVLARFFFNDPDGAEARRQPPSAVAALPAQGLDFADALHLARSSRAAAFLTFDRRLAKRAKDLARSPPVEWLA